MTASGGRVSVDTGHHTVNERHGALADMAPSSAKGMLRRLELLTDREHIARDLHEAIAHLSYAAALARQGGLTLIADPVVDPRMQDAVSVVLDLTNDVD